MATLPPMMMMIMINDNNNNDDDNDDAAADAGDDAADLPLAAVLTDLVSAIRWQPAATSRQKPIEGM